MSRLHLYLVAALLTLAGVGLFLYKVIALGFPLEPGAETEVWTVQARFSVEADRGPIKAILQIPKDPPGFTILHESFVSRGYGLTTRDEVDGREAQWAVREATGRQTLYYRAVVVGERTRREQTPPEEVEPPGIEEPFRTAMLMVIGEARRRSADTATFTAEILRQLSEESPSESVDLLLSYGRSPARKAQIAVDVLAVAESPARVVYGLELEDRQRHAAFIPWLEVWDGRRWLFFDPATGEEGLPRNFLLWWRGERPVISVLGADNPEVDVAVWGESEEMMEVAERRAELRGSRAVEFSLLGLPLQTQSVYSVMLLVPIGAFVMVVLRNVVGVSTFGTFMPILVALAFRETRLLMGIVLFSAVMILGLVIRFYLERLRLLLVPRLSAVLILVVLLMATISILSHRLGLETGLSVALFPLVILTMSIERMSIVWEERGPGEAFKEGGGTLLVAAVGYLAMTQDLVEHLVFVYPELLLVVLAATLLLGRYRGYRLLELFRFRELVGKKT